jgi:hypothetical protein
MPPDPMQGVDKIPMSIDGPGENDRVFDSLSTALAEMRSVHGRHRPATCHSRATKEAPDRAPRSQQILPRYPNALIDP